MATSFIPLSAIIAVLIITFLFAFLLQVSHKTRYIVLCREELEEDWHKV